MDLNSSNACATACFIVITVSMLFYRFSQKNWNGHYFLLLAIFTAVAGLSDHYHEGFEHTFYLWGTAVLGGSYILVSLIRFFLVGGEIP